MPIFVWGFSYPTPIAFNTQHFQALNDLLIRLFGSLAVLADVSFFFIPDILAQKERFRAPPSGCGAFNPGLPGFAAL
jgi:hypothetical protein